MKSIRDLKDLSGKRALLRVDYNVPIENGTVGDRTRLRSTIPTITHLREAGAVVIIMTHIGRPEGKKDPALSTKPVATALWEELGEKVTYIDDIAGEKTKSALAGAAPGDVFLLENLRFSPDEKKNTGTLAMDLANLADVFVEDGFAVCHRAAASTVGVPQHIESYGGILLQDEVANLSRILQSPADPFVVVLGGAKIETKLPVLDNLAPTASRVLLGGALVNTCLAAQGYGVGKSLVDTDMTDAALSVVQHKKIMLPVDLVVGDHDGRRYRTIDIPAAPAELCGPKEGIFDIGPKTVQLFAKEIKAAKTLVWNGAMGYFEQDPYHHGTHAIARLVASRSTGEAFGVIGGGETILSMEQVGMTEHIDFVSTGGGAMLEFLAGDTLPGIAALG